MIMKCFKTRHKNANSFYFSNFPDFYSRTIFETLFEMKPLFEIFNENFNIKRDNDKKIKFNFLVVAMFFTTIFRNKKPLRYVNVNHTLIREFETRFNFSSWPTMFTSVSILNDVLNNSRANEFIENIFIMFNERDTINEFTICFVCVSFVHLLFMLF